MEEKNQFSTLLEHLMTTCEVKNYTLAQELQYDVSYISKWVSGRMLPSEKTSEKVLKGISRCIANSVTEKSRAQFYANYQVDDDRDLERAIYDNLETTYNYVKDLKKNTGSEVAPITSYYAELSLSQFIPRMKHPVLRRVQSLNIVAAMDLLAVGHEYRPMITRIEKKHMDPNRDFLNVHYLMIINLEVGEKDYVYDSIFLMGMLTDNTSIDFQLYGGVQAYGKMIFSVGKEYVISGMLMDSNSCMSVMVSEDEAICDSIYTRVKSLCSREMLLVRKVSMQEMLRKHDYVQSVLSTNLRWLIGHMTEHFLPEDLFEEILAKVYDPQKWQVNLDEVRRIYMLTKNILEESKVHIMIYESAFTEFAVSGELDFYNCKIQLSTEQRLRYMKNILELMQKENGLEIKMIHGDLVANFQHSANPCLFLSDVICYLRIYNRNYQNNVMILNAVSIRDMFSRFYREVWKNRHDAVIDDRNVIMGMVNHAMQSVHFLSRMEQD